MFPVKLQTGKHSRSLHVLRHMLAFSLALTAGSALAFGPQSSNKATEWGFDFVEEFDGLQDWAPPPPSGDSPNTSSYVYATDYPNLMPKLANGSNSAWVFWTGSAKQTQPWIGGGSNRPVWRGSKSLSIDLGGSGRGASRLGVYFGDPSNPHNNPSWGYKNFRLFYMVWIPKNMFPTSCEGSSCAGGGPIGTYTAGQPYAYIASWKFNNINIGCHAIRCPYNGTYGNAYTVTNIGKYNYGAHPGMHLLNANMTDGTNIWAAEGARNLDSLFGDWMGVEYWIRNTSDNSSYLMDMWVYDKNGNADHQMKSRQYAINSSGRGPNWDYFVFGGNNANSWTWGPTMQSWYYVDDFIVDAGHKGQIGTRYFQAIGATRNAVPPAPPANASGAQIQ